MSLADDVERLARALENATRTILEPVVDVLGSWHQRIEARRCAKTHHAPARDKATGRIVCVYCRTPLDRQ